MATQKKHDEQELRKRLKELHDEGVINLDAPLREVIPRLEEHAQKILSRNGGQREALAEAYAYCLVGDKGWLAHE